MPYYGTPLERFERKYDEGKNCWIWTACLNDDGYGLFRYKGRMHNAHRISYILYRGPIPKGKMVCHTCDIPRCVNPEHLFLGDQTANMRDMVAKKRYADNRGEKNPACKLTIEQVKFIKSNYIARHRCWGGSALARKFGVSKSLVGAIVTGKCWAHL